MSVNMKNFSRCKEMLRDHSKFYVQKVREETLDAYAEKLCNMDLNLIYKSLDGIASIAGARFPTLSEIKSHMDAKATDQDYAKMEYNAELSKENEKIENIIKFIDSMIPKSDMEKYFTFYFKRFFGADTYESILSGQILDLSLFKRCAYVDLYKARLKPAEAILVLQKEYEVNAKRRSDRDYKPKAININYWH